MNGPERRESPEKVVDALVGAGADVNARDDGGMTPLMRAAMSHSWTGNRANPLVAVLVGKGANLSDRDKLGRTALHFASYSGDYDTVVFLHLRGMNLSAGDDMGLTPLHYAVLNVRSYRVYMYIQEESGAAEQARKEKHRALIEFLVSKADINAADKRGNTALHYADAMAAAERQSIYPPPVITFWKDKYQDVVGILKAAGARDDMKNKDGLTPAVLAGTPGK
jgi:ankyrin repeat protein